MLSQRYHKASTRLIRIAFITLFATVVAIGGPAAAGGDHGGGGHVVPKAA